MLQLFGLSSSTTAFLLSLCLGSLAGLAEEVFFRGLVFSSLETFAGASAATLISSAIFGLAHRPVFGANALAEAVFGGCLAYIYWYSDYNLATPVLVHAIYDICTIFVTWRSASKDLQEIMRYEDNRLRAAAEDLANGSSFDSFCQAVKFLFLRQFVLTSMSRFSTLWISIMMEVLI